MKINIPTKITIARIVLIVALLLGLITCDIVSAITGWKQPMIGHGVSLIGLISMIVFVVASFTDYLDGHLARKWNMVTTLGKFLDPIADKMLTTSMLVYLAARSGEKLLVYCVIIMIIRDLVVDALRSIAASKNVILAANMWGKVKTVLQMICIPFWLLGGWPFTYFDASWGYGRICYLILFVTTIASILSGSVYVIQNAKVLKEGE